MRELTERIIALTNAWSRIVHRPLPQDDPIQRCPDIPPARQTLGWEPKVPLDTGLAKTIAYFDELLRSRTAPLRLKHDPEDRASG